MPSAIIYRAYHEFHLPEYQKNTVLHITSYNFVEKICIFCIFRFLIIGQNLKTTRNIDIIMTQSGQSSRTFQGIPGC